MKHTAIILTAITILIASACHKKTSAIGNTIAPDNVASTIDSSAIMQHYKVDRFDGVYVDVQDYWQIDRKSVSFYLRRTQPDGKGRIIITCSSDLPLGYLSRPNYASTAVNDTIVYTGPGPYSAGSLNFNIGGNNINDTLRVSWSYAVDGQADLGDHDCSFQGILVK